jgi:hypothetical protein
MDTDSAAQKSGFKLRVATGARAANILRVGFSKRLHADAEADWEGDA